MIKIDDGFIKEAKTELERSVKVPVKNILDDTESDEASALNHTNATPGAIADVSSEQPRNQWHLGIADDLSGQPRN